MWLDRWQVVHLSKNGGEELVGVVGELVGSGRADDRGDLGKAPKMLERSRKRGR